MKLVYPSGATPLDPNEVGGLLLPLSTQAELNEFEHESIIQATRAAKRSKRLRRELLTVSGLKELHRQMFSGVWEWAGSVRLTHKNIGVNVSDIQPQLQQLCENIEYRIAHKVGSWPEIALHFHHQLVWIHPFPNGNGRWSRLATDLLLYFNNQQIPTWGSINLINESKERGRYLEALRMADRDPTQLSALIKFAYG